jgi:hypothetical protein
LSARHTLRKSKLPREGVPPKSRETAISGQHSPVGRKYREDHHAHHCVARPCSSERRRNDCLGKEGARSIGLRGSELLMVRPARIVRLVEPLPPTGQGLRESQSQRSRLPQTRFHPASCYESCAILNKVPSRWRYPAGSSPAPLRGDVGSVRFMDRQRRRRPASPAVPWSTASSPQTPG